MADKRPEDASATFIASQWLALSCISDCAVFSSGARVGQEESHTIWDPGQRRANIVRLIAHGGIGELDVRIALDYLVEVTGVQEFAVHTTGYRFLVSDIAGQALIAYDWHPTGLSLVITPHLHIPAARSVVLAQRHGTPRADTRTYLGSLHLPTGQISLADIVRMSITEFRVDPTRDDWEQRLRLTQRTRSIYARTTAQVELDLAPAHVAGRD